MLAWSLKRNAGLVPLPPSLSADALKPLLQALLPAPGHTFLLVSCRFWELQINLASLDGISPPFPPTSLLAFQKEACFLFICLFVFLSSPGGIASCSESSSANSGGHTQPGVGARQVPPGSWCCVIQGRLSDISVPWSLSFIKCRQ